MKVARHFRDSGIPFVQSEFYRDRESDDLREIDISARIPLGDIGYPDAIPAFLCPVVECKSSPGKPWILFSGGVSLTDAAKVAQRHVLAEVGRHWRTYSHRASRGKFKSEEKWEDRLPFFAISENNAYSAVRTSLGKSREDAAYAAMMSVTKAADGTANMYPHRGNMAYQIAVPIIVVDAPIFTCSLDSEGDPVLSRIEKGTIVWRNKVTAGGPPHAIITIVCEQAIPELCAAINKTAESLREDLNLVPRPVLED
ncbi:hypothetical protein [Streptomyces sp. NPDC059894]|uniref:hypothetical protein n=1 Tax=unclassified Streptomyces TaxID=2593676 RepID=UPI00364CC587